MIIYTNSGKQISENRTFKPTPDYTNPSLIKVGIGANPVKIPSIADTGLTNEIPFGTFTTIDNCDSLTGWSAINGTISLNSSIRVDSTNAIDIQKTDAGDSNVRVSKGTLTSFNFTDSFLFWVYIDPTILSNLTFITFNIGQNLANSYYWTLPASSFLGGWNCVYGITVANATGSTGSPTPTGCVYFRLYLTTNQPTVVWSTNLVVLDAINTYVPSTISTTNTISTANNTITITSSLPANTFTTDSETWIVPLAEMGVFNTDSPKKIFDHSKFTTLSFDGLSDLNIEEQYIFNQ